MKALTLAMALAMGVSTAQAAPILFNFGGDTPTQGGTWNTLVTPNVGVAAGGLVDSEGAVLAGVSVTASSFASDISDGDKNDTPDTAWAHSDTTFADAAAVEFAWDTEQGVEATFVISGLDPLVNYNISMIAARNDGTNTTPGHNQYKNRLGTYLLNGEASSAGNPFQAKVQGWINGEMLQWTNMSLDANGDLTLTISSYQPDDGQAFLNALKVEVVPEPASLALLGLGGATMLLRRRG